MPRKRKDIRVDSEVQEVFAERAKALAMTHEELLKTLLQKEITYSTTVKINEMSKRIEGGE